MLTFHGTLSADRQRDLTDHLDAHWAPRLTRDKSSYAPERLTAWIGAIPTFSRTPTFTPTTPDERIMSYARRLAAGSGFVDSLDLALVHKGGNISAHRDATYAMPIAFTINLGACVFTYNGKAHRLKGGEVFTFDCKNLHAVSEASPDRWAINLWTRRDNIDTGYNLNQRWTSDPTLGL